MEKTKTGNDTLIQMIMELHPYEMQLLHSLRNKFKYGDITISMRNGLPYEWKRITEIERPF